MLPASSSLAAFDATVRARTGARLLAGTDEVGRGCLAGPVVAAAVVLPSDACLPGVRDSKALTAEARAQTRHEIEAVALGIGVGACSVEEIDRLNILHAAMEAMRRAVAALTDPRTGAPVVPEVVLVDGNRLPPGLPCDAEAVVKGDARSLAIAAASIVAKEHRDALLRTLAAEHPAYGWERNAAYPTAEHRAAIAAHGPTVHHRRSFRLL